MIWSCYTMNDLVSVIVPVYNVEQYLDRCVESIINQTYENLEIILVDDGSPDNCPQMCDEWAKKDNRIKVIHKENGGSSTARNAGLDLAKGDYISFIDSDDYIDKCMISELLNSILHCSSRISICGNYEVNSEGVLFDNKLSFINNPVDYAECIMFVRDLHFYVHESLCNKLYSKDIWSNTRLDELCLKYEDSAIIPFLYEKAQSISIVNKPLYYYFQNPDSKTASTVTINDLELKFTILKERFEYFGLLRKDLYEHYIISNMRDIRNSYFLYNDKDKRVLLISQMKEYLKILKNNCFSKELFAHYALFCYFPRIYNLINSIRNRYRIN